MAAVMLGCDSIEMAMVDFLMDFVEFLKNVVYLAEVQKNEQMIVPLLCVSFFVVRSRFGAAGALPVSVLPFLQSDTRCLQCLYLKFTKLMLYCTFQKLN